VIVSPREIVWMLEANDDTQMLAFGRSFRKGRHPARWQREPQLHGPCQPTRTTGSSANPYQRYECSHDRATPPVGVDQFFEEARRLLNITAVRAFPMDMFAPAENVPSSRSNAMRLPPSSTTAITPPGASSF